jgi:ABC-2 type transport system ATP-binding protein
VAAVEVHSLVVRYGDLVAVDGLSFQAESGRVTTLLGPNGAGKTTTVEVLEGFRRPTGGRAVVAGLDPLRDHHEVVSRVGVMLQRGGIYPGIKVLEAARLFCRLYGDVEDPHALLDRVDLTARARYTWRQLSGGEQQRLSLATALAGRPEVVFLDEPTASLDVAGRQLVRAVVRELADGGCCVVMTTHELDEAERLSDHVVIVDHGRLVAEGSPASLRDATTSDEIRFAAAPRLDTAALSARLDAAVKEATPGEYVVDTAPTPQAVASLTAWLADQGVALADLRAGRQSLEDVFLRLTTSPPEVPPGESPPRRRR